MSLGMSSTSRKPKAKTSASGPCGTGCKGGNCGDCKPKAEGGGCCGGNAQGGGCCKDEPAPKAEKAEGGCCGGNAQGGGCCKDEPAPATDAPSSGLLKLALPALLISNLFTFPSSSSTQLLFLLVSSFSVWYCGTCSLFWQESIKKPFNRRLRRQFSELPTIKCTHMVFYTSPIWPELLLVFDMCLSFIAEGR